MLPVLDSKIEVNEDMFWSLYKLYMAVHKTKDKINDSAVQYEYMRASVWIKPE